MSKPSIKQVADIATLQTGSKVVNADMTEYDGDQLVWRLKADTAQDKGDTFELERPRLIMVLNNGEEMPIQAKQGKYHKTKKVIHFNGSAMVNYQAWKLTSQAMAYTQRTGELIVPEDFRLTQEGITVIGKDLHVFRDSGILQVMEGVHMHIEEAP